MLYPGTNEMPDVSKSCSKGGQLVARVIRNSSGGVTPGVVKAILILLVVVLLGGAAFAVSSDMFKGGPDPNQGFNPQGRGWVPMDFDFAGMELEVPGEGWQLYYDARTQVVFKDGLNNTLDIFFIGASALNPDMYRVDNKPQVFRILKQEVITLEGWNEEAMYTVVQGNENGYIVNKHQLFFRRTFKAPKSIAQTYTYLITMTFSSGQESQYAPRFQHIINSIKLYEAN